MFLPPFDDFADPRRLVDLAIAAEESGWDGFFLWDHVLRWPGHEGRVGDLDGAGGGRGADKPHPYRSAHHPDCPQMAPQIRAGGR